VPFGGSLTGVAALPPGSQRDKVDPFAEKKSPWPTIIVLVFVLVLAYVALNKMGYIYDWTNGRLGDPKPVQAEKAAPAAKAAPEAAAKPAEATK
jgi:cytochrome c-type biogenesis protein CcmH/NrfG